MGSRNKIKLQVIKTFPFQFFFRSKIRHKTQGDIFDINGKHEAVYKNYSNKSSVIHSL